MKTRIEPQYVYIAVLCNYDGHVWVESVKKSDKETYRGGCTAYRGDTAAIRRLRARYREGTGVSRHSIGGEGLRVVEGASKEVCGALLAAQLVCASVIAS